MRLILLTPLLMLALPVPADDAPTTKELRPLYTAIERGYQRRSVKLIVAQWADDYSETSEAGAISDRAKVEKTLRQNFAQGDSWKVTYQLLGAKRLEPTTAEAWVRKRLLMTGGGLTARGHWTERHTWTRVDGKWRLRTVEVIKSLL